MSESCAENLLRCKTCGHARYQHGKGCGGPGVPPAVVCLCQGFDGPPLSINLEAEVRRLRSEKRGDQEALGAAVARIEAAEAERDAAIRERDEARAAIDYAMSERAAAMDGAARRKAESAALRARLEEARAVIETLVGCEIDVDVLALCRKCHEKAAAFLAADPKESTR